MGSGGPRDRAREAIIRLAHAGLDSVTLRRELAARIHRVVPVAASGFATLDPATLLVTSVVGEEIPAAAVPLLLQNEYAQDDFNKFADLALRRHPVGRLSAVTEGELTKSLRYRTIFESVGWGDELRAVFVADHLGWGFICMHRERSDRAFSREDELFLSQLVSHVGDGLRKALLIGAASAQSYNPGPGLLELTDELEVSAMNDAAAAWLDELEVDETRGSRRLPHAVSAIFSQLKALDAAPLAAAPPRLPVRARSGRWLVLHASHLRGQGAHGRTAIIIEPAKPLELAPLITRAYGLSTRESQIVLLVLHGLSTTQIANRLHISTSTVQDHLKAVFAKAGVHSRRELVGQVFLESSPR